MATIEEKRRLLDAKLKEMAQEGVMKKTPKKTLAFDPPEETASALLPSDETALLEKVVKPTPRQVVQPDAHISGGEHENLSIEDYRERYLQPVRMREKTAFTMNMQTLQILRNVLQDLNERVSMASYIDNILREHLKTHKEMLNNATAKQRRKNTVTL